MRQRVPLSIDEGAKLRSEAERKSVHLDAAPPADDEVTEFVHEHDDAQNDQRRG